MPKHIGIVSMSTPGTLSCYNSICDFSREKLGLYHHPQISVHSFSLADYLPAISQGDWQRVSDLLIDSAKKVAASGAEFAICPANTAHEAFHLFADRSPIPFLHIVEGVANEAVRLGLRKLGLLGTKFIMGGGIYREVLSRQKIELVVPDQRDREIINEKIYSELVHGIFNDETRGYFKSLIERLNSEGCEGVILGCTEIPLVVNPSVSPCPLLDSTALLARAAVMKSLG